ncbi:sonic hedgehog protein-like [Physella acuta]|uniref:sonic hedgehog protein-like n=1 Tax=Physella acuta TaxID=109671 RepID=UPI0027DC6D0F|nr:sonic hedgehog protein-like [Physella acuta]
MYSTLGKSFTKQVQCVGHLIQCLHEVLKDICHIDHLVALDVEEKNCFPKGSSVLLENGRKELVENLSPGMKVLAFDKKKGFVYDEIYMFGHKQGNAVSKFVVVHTESHQITISPEHLILCKKNDTESFVTAKTVSLGDEILTKSELGFVWSSVADVTYRVDRGLYAPFTRSGTIVVDGVVASCYIDVLPHDVCHRMVSPIRCLYRVSPSLVRRVCGVSDTQPVPKIAHLAVTVLWYGKKITKERQRALKLF